MSLITLIFFILFTLITCKFPDNKTKDDIDLIYSAKYLEFNTTEKINNLYLQHSKSYAFPNTIRINNRGELFISVPRHLFREKIDKYIPGTINCLKDGKLNPWPNQEENDFDTGRIHSIVGFEIDLDGNLYLLNHKENKERELLVYYKNGTIKDVYNLTQVTTHKEHESLLTNIILDLTYDFAYITDTGKIFDEDYKNSKNKNDTKSSLLVLNLKNKVTIRFLRKEKSSMPDLSLPKINSKINIDDIGLYGIALSCDKRFLYYTPVKSDKLYKINTLYLQDERTLRNKDINILNKKYSSFEIMSSARGLFYYTSIEENSVLVNFYERILSFNNVRSVSHGKLFDDNVPVSLTFNGTTGYLFYLVNRHHIFINDNIVKKLDINQDNFFIYKVKTNDRSYLYPCNIYSYIPNSTWIAIIIISLMLSYGVFKLIVFVTKLSPKKKEMEMNEEELAYINDEEN